MVYMILKMWFNFSFQLFLFLITFVAPNPRLVLSHHYVTSTDDPLMERVQEISAPVPLALTGSYRTCNPPESMGPFVCGVIPPIISLLPPTIPIPFSCEPPTNLDNCTHEIYLPNLADFMNTILPNSTLKVTGSLLLRNLTIVHLNETTMDICNFTLGEDPEGPSDPVGPVRMEMGIKLPVLTIEVLFDVNATVASLFPIYGQGVATLSFAGFDFGLDTTISYCPTNESMGIPAFQYHLGLPDLSVNLDGFLGNIEFVEEVEKLIKIQLLDPIINDLADAESANHANLVYIIQFYGNVFLGAIYPCEIPLLAMIFGDCLK